MSKLIFDASKTAPLPQVDDTEEDGNVVQLTTGNPILDKALSYANIGWHIFPCWSVTETPEGDLACGCGNENCGSPGKHPWRGVRNGQDSATTDHAQIRQWWERYPDANIGCLMSRSGLLAVDIDPRNGGLLTIEALEDKHGPIYSDVLQFTGGGGEHRIFAMHDDKSYPGKLGDGVDIKRNGYIILEPSRHISGGTYEFEASSDPTDGAYPSPLPDWIIGNQVHQFTDYNSSVVMTKYIDEDGINELEDALTYISSDDRDQWVNIGNALAPLGQAGFDLWDAWSQKSDKYNATDALRVWRSFRNGDFTTASIYYIAQESGWTNPASSGSKVEAPEANEEPTDNPPSTVPPPPAPNDSSTPFPRLNKTIEWLDKYSTKSNPVISLAGAFSIIQAATARVYRSEHFYNGTTTYIAVIARTGAGKDYIRKAYSKLFAEIGCMDNTSIGNFSSGSSIRDTMADHPWVVAYLDEFGDMIKHGTQDKGGPARDRLSTLRKAYSQDGELERTAYANRNRGTKLDSTSLAKPVIDPHLGIIGLTTKQQFLTALSEAMLEDGTMNRFIYMDADTPPSYNRLPQFDPPQWLIDHIRDLRNGGPISEGTNLPMSEIADIRPSYITVPWAEDALTYFHEIGDVEDPSSIIGRWCIDSPHRTAMAARARENAMRLATGITVFESLHEITKDTLEWCFNHVFSCVNDFHKVYLEHAQTDQRMENIRFLVSAVVRLHKLKKDRSGYCGVTKSDITHKTARKLDRKTRDMIMADLVESGVIKLTANHNGKEGKSGKVITRYLPDLRRCETFLEADEDRD